jgi:hypothetical protein
MAASMRIQGKPTSNAAQTMRCCAMLHLAAQLIYNNGTACPLGMGRDIGSD